MRRADGLGCHIATAERTAGRVQRGLAATIPNPSPATAPAIRRRLLIWWVFPLFGEN